MPTRDLYTVLGIPRTASDKEVRQAYRRLARQHHPDLNPDDHAAESRFKEISEAYEVLSDKQRRAQYDRFGHIPNGRPTVTPGGPGFGNMGWASTETMGGSGGMENLIEQLLHGVGRKRPGANSARRSQATERTIEVTLAEAVMGTTRRVQVAQPGESSRTLEVTVQPGVGDGTRIRMAGQGTPGFAGEPAGDLFLIVRIIADPRFERRQDDLYTTLDVPFYRAALGGEVEVPTPTGARLALAIPAETHGGQRFRLAGQGMPRLGQSVRGDLYAEVRITIPDDLTDRERVLLHELAQLRGAAPR
ncbi:MAG: DnaJ C-terminal domain-containing protein [Chloroflexota bacterium]